MQELCRVALRCALALAVVGINRGKAFRKFELSESINVVSQPAFAAL
jgi:hypothetical protein